MQSVIQFVVSHEVIIAAGAVAALDFLFAINSGLKSNGILHFFYVQAQTLAGKGGDTPAK